MKLNIRILLWTLIFCLICHLANCLSLNNPIVGSIEKFEKFEIDVELPVSIETLISDFFTTGVGINPYNYHNIDVYAVITSPSEKKYRVNGFWWEEWRKDANTINPNLAWPVENISANTSKGFKIRFAPNEEGDWTFSIHIETASLISAIPERVFICVPSENKGFIHAKMKRYLEFENGEGFIPLGANYSWFSRDPFRGQFETGTNEIKDIIDDFASRGMNKFRFWINYMEGLNIQGRDYTLDKNFFTMFNQKDSKQLDDIMNYAQANDVYLELSLFSHSQWGNTDYAHNIWNRDNPYHTNVANPPQFPDRTGNLTNPYHFYIESDALDIQRQYIRYVIARWGHHTSLFGLDLWDEADRFQHVNNDIPIPNDLYEDYLNSILPTPVSLSFLPSYLQFKIMIGIWHTNMFSFIRSNDPYNHILSTSYADYNDLSTLWVYPKSDYIGTHYYVYVPEIGPTHEEYFYFRSKSHHNKYDKPHRVTETMWIDPSELEAKDPSSYGLHNMLWGTLFNGDYGPIEMWHYWDIDGIHKPGSFGKDNFDGIGIFLNELPKLTDIYIPKKHYSRPSDIPRYIGLRLHYLENINRDKFYGWVQDLRWTTANVYNTHPNYMLTLHSPSPVDKPVPTSPLQNLNFDVSRNGTYELKWFNTETGILHSSTMLTTNNKHLEFPFPINLNRSKYGDGAFSLEYVCGEFWSCSVLNNEAPRHAHYSTAVDPTNGNVFFKGGESRIHQMYWNGSFWKYALLNPLSERNAMIISPLVTDNDGRVYYIGNDRRIWYYYWNGSLWVQEVLNINAPPNVSFASDLTIDHIGKIYYTGTDSRIHHMYWNGSIWVAGVLNSTTPTNVKAFSQLDADSNGRIYYIGTDNRIHLMYWNGTNWAHTVLNSIAPPNVSEGWLSVNRLNNNVFYKGTDSRIHRMFWSGSQWLHEVLSLSAPQNVVGNLTTDATGKIHYKATDNSIHHMYWNDSIGQWMHAINNIDCEKNVYNGLSTDLNGNVFYIGTDAKIHVSYYGCQNKY